MLKQFSKSDFKECMGLYSTGIAIASTRDKNYNNVALTINSFTSVSLTPSLILFCIDREYSAVQAFLNSDFFAITILSSHQKGLAKQFATSCDNQWDNVNFILGATKCPIICPHLAFLECEKYAVYEAGDHFIILGEVLTLDIIRNEQQSPLIYFKGDYYNLPQPA